MPLHRVDSLTLGVPDLAAATAFYEDFGLARCGAPAGAGARATLATKEGGDQLELVPSLVRRLVQATFAADDGDDVLRIVGAWWTAHRMTGRVSAGPVSS